MEDTNPYKTPEASLTPEDTQEMELASRWQRFFGSLLDGLISGLPAAGIFYYLGVYGRMAEDGTLPLTDQVTTFVIGVAVFMVINAYLLYSQGQTVGKMIVRTRVVTLTGEQVSGNTYVFLRLLPIWLLSQIPIAGNFVGFVDAVLIFRKEKNCLHDDIARTRVVRA